MIEIDHVTKVFGEETVLSKISAQIARGSVYGLIGSNGAGKSTLLRIISGVLEADEGGALIEGTAVFENTAIKQKLFYISDQQMILPNDSMADMAQYYAAVYDGFSMQEFNRYCSAYRLDPQKRMGTFSKGMQKCAGLVFALASGATYLFCDETFDGLDPVMREVTKRILSSEALGRGLTPVIASHNLRELEDICDHVGLLHEGGIVFNTDVERLRTNLHRIQCAFEEEKTFADFEGMDILNFLAKQRLCVLTVRGKLEEIETQLSTMKPLFVDILPLSLEEIFVSEMEAIGYDAQKIIV